MPDLLLFRIALRDLLRPRRLLAAAPLILLPALLGLLWRWGDRTSHFQPESIYNLLAGSVVMGFSLVILAVVFGTGVIAQELEGRTILYLLTRPIARARILLSKFLGAFVGISVTMWISTILLAMVVFGPTAWMRPIVLRDLAVLLVGALAYGALFLLIAACVNRPLVYGLFFAFGWESWVPLLPGAFQKLSIQTYLRVLAPHPHEARVPSGVSELLATLNPQAISPAFARHVLAGTILVALALAVWVFS